MNTVNPTQPEEGLANVCCKGPDYKHIGFAGHTVSVASPQPCCSSKAVIDNL